MPPDNPPVSYLPRINDSLIALSMQPKHTNKIRLAINKTGTPTPCLSLLDPD